MRIGSAFPRLLERRYPTVKPSYSLVSVLYLLRMVDVAAVPLSEGLTSRRAVFGYSSLPKLMNLSPAAFDEFLDGPCERGAEKLDSFGLEDDVEKLLEAFKKRKLGFSLVNGKVRGEPRTILVSLVDIMGLYKTKQITSDMLVGEVSSPIFSMAGKSSIREALSAMFRLTHRTVFISGQRKYISDRSIIDRVFGPSSLDRIREGSKTDVLDAKIGALDKMTPIEVGGRTSLQAAVLRLEDWGPCLAIKKKEEVVTAWDLVMKPWESGRLTISART